MTVSQIDNIPGIVDPTSMDEFKLAVTSLQHTKSSIFAFNAILSLQEELVALRAELDGLKKPIPARTAKAKNASNQSGGTFEEDAEADK